jgi:hypothetical protein
LFNEALSGFYRSTQAVAEARAARGTEAAATPEPAEPIEEHAHTL